MWLRYLSATFCLLFGLLLLFIIIDQGIYLGFKLDWRTLVAVVAVICSIAVFFRQSIFFVIFAMTLQTGTQFLSTVDIIGAMMLGRWAYSWIDVWSLPLVILPVFSMATAILADGRAQQAYSFFRYRPHQENA